MIISPIFQNTPFDIVVLVLDHAQRLNYLSKQEQVEIYKVVVELRLVHIRNKFLVRWYNWSSASKAGNIDILNILFSYYNRFPKLVTKPNNLDTHCALLLAGVHGHVHVLDWWILSGFRLAWANHQMDEASKFNQVHVLQWWKDSGLPLRYRLGKTFALHSGSNETIKWWATSGLPDKSTICTCPICSCNM